MLALFNGCTETWIAQEEWRSILLNATDYVPDPRCAAAKRRPICAQPWRRRSSVHDGKGRSRAVRLGFQCIMSENKFFLVRHNSHLVPVIRKFLAAFEANHICARQVRGTRTALPALYALRETRVQVPATEQQVE